MSHQNLAMSPQAVEFLTRCMANMIDSICCTESDRRLAKELYDLLAPICKTPRYTAITGPKYTTIKDAESPLHPVALIRNGSDLNPQQLCDTLNK